MRVSELLADIYLAEGLWFDERREFWLLEGPAENWPREWGLS